MKKLKLILVISMVVLGIIFTNLLSFADFETETKIVKDTILKIESGLKRYRMVNSIYPEDSNKRLVSALFPNYLTLQSLTIKDGLLIDPWGHPYVYQRYDPGDNLKWHTYVIYSIGPNGVDEDGNGDDIGNL